jgi:hypothetical protein
MKTIVAFFSLVLVLSSCNTSPGKQEAGTVDTLISNTLTPAEQTDGWQLLFDGNSLTGWKGYLVDSITSNWQVANGCLQALGKGDDHSGYIVTRDTFSNFHLKLDFKLTKGSNSGIFYGVVDGNYPTPYATGPEYQLIDGANWPDKLEDWQNVGADYAMHTAPSAKPNPINEWNTAEIIVLGTHVEHWLNGTKIVDFERWTPEWTKLKTEGKWKDYPDYGMAKAGRLGLQDHGSVVYFRNFKIKKL